MMKDLNHRSGSFGLVVDSYGRVVNPNATPGSYVPPGCRYMPAPMPYFMEFSRSVGMHGGYLPGYPASHGCVRMPRDLAAEFFAQVHVGTPVKVIGSSRNVTTVRRAIPVVQQTGLVQPGGSRYATAFSGSRGRSHFSIFRYLNFFEACLRGETASLSSDSFYFQSGALRLL